MFVKLKLDDWENIPSLKLFLISLITDSIVLERLLKYSMSSCKYETKISTIYTRPHCIYDSSVLIETDKIFMQLLKWYSFNWNCVLWSFKRCTANMNHQILSDVERSRILCIIVPFLNVPRCCNTVNFPQDMLFLIHWPLTLSAMHNIV